MTPTTSYLWDSGSHRFLFTGDFVWIENGEWKAVVLASSNRADYLDSLALVRELDFDVLVPWGTTEGDPSLAPVNKAEIRARLDAIIARVPYRHTTLETSVATAIIAAMRRHGVRRLIVTSSVGVGDSMANIPFSTKVVVRTFLRGSTEDKARMESAVRGSGLDWVITRPAVLNEKPATGDVRVFSSGSRDKAQAITRADLAAFLLVQLTSDEHLRKTVTLANP